MNTPSETEIHAVAGLFRPALEAARAAVAPLSTNPQLRTAVAKMLIADQLLDLCGGVDETDSPHAAAQNELVQERIGTILAFIDLAKEHSLPRKLLPREDRFRPGTRVTIRGRAGTVEPPLDLVRVRLDGEEHAADYPRGTVESGE